MKFTCEDCINYSALSDFEGYCYEQDRLTSNEPICSEFERREDNYSKEGA